MLSYRQPPDREGKVSQFLLVPDPGTWIHPSHLEPGEVVLVRTLSGARVPLMDRKPVWVEGQLAASTVTRDNLEGALELTAQSVSEFAQRK